jgi:hypothetical protein
MDWFQTLRLLTLMTMKMTATYRTNLSIQLKIWSLGLWTSWIVEVAFCMCGTCWLRDLLAAAHTVRESTSPTALIHFSPCCVPSWKCQVGSHLFESYCFHSYLLLNFQGQNLDSIASTTFCCQLCKIGWGKQAGFSEVGTTLLPISNSAAVWQQIWL